MPRGGKRLGAGAKLGSTQKRTLEKAEAQRMFRAGVQEHFAPLLAAQVKVALSGNTQALKEIWDRFIGPPKESMDLDVRGSFTELVKVIHEHQVIRSSSSVENP